MIPATEGTAPIARSGQLVLSRKPREQIIIGEGPDRIIITVLRMEAGKVRLGINAPRGLPVHRAEVFHDIQAGGA
jgi:carbon storage regulator